jgi:pyridoxal phosphate enzyme (YggS family)
MSVAENIAAIQARTAQAAHRVGRRPEEIALMAVSKTHPPEKIREAYAAGLRLFGENKVQEFAGKFAALKDLPDAKFQMIGHLQSNKAAKAAELFSAIDSVDSLRLAEKLNIAAAAENKQLAILIEINIAGEAAKSGIAPDSPELQALLQAAPRLEHLSFRGLMTVPPIADDPESARPFFKRLRALREQIAAQHLPSIGLDELSMGMSHDFEVAIEEGSTCVRVGTAIFGEREKP